MKEARSYQTTARQRVHQEFESNKSTLLCLFAGGGKTFTAALVVKDFVDQGKKVLWLAHREELIYQAKATLEEFGLKVNEWTQNKKEKYADNAVTTAMYLSCKELPKQWDLIVCDEAHHAASESYKKLLGTIKYNKLLGLSVGPESFIELKGGIFKDGYIGSIEDAWNLAIKHFNIEKIDEYDILKLNNVLSRGWEENHFQWKEIKTFIRHPCTKTCKDIKVAGDILTLTNDHSIYTISKESKGLLSEQKTDNLKVKDITLHDVGYENSGDEEIDVISLLIKLEITNRIHVAVDLTNISSKILDSLDIPYKTQWYCRNKGKYGSYLPILKFEKIKHLLPSPTKIYYESCNSLWLSPIIKLSDWAYFIGFFYGDGWFSGKRIGLAVENARVDSITNLIKDLPSVKVGIEIRETKGKSKEIRISNHLFSSILKYFLGNKRCFEKEINGSLILNWTKEKRINLLNGLIDSDGHLSCRSQNKKEYYYTTTSNKLARSLLSLLRSVGVKGGIHKRKFQEKGGIIDGRQIINKRNSYSVYWSYYSMIGENQKKKGYRSSIDHYNLDFIEAPIKKIEEVKVLPKYVYDFEMKGHPSFVANGILVHNTATPYRMDRKELEFDSIAYQRGYAELVKDGYLCSMVYTKIKTKYNSALKFTGKDYTQKSLDQLDDIKRNQIIADLYNKDMGKTLIFMPTVHSCYETEKILKEKGIKAVVLEAETENRKDIIKGFEGTIYDVILNVMIATEGTDIPCIQTVILARPTASKGLYLQMVGRGARLHLFKPNNEFKVYDLVDNDTHYAAMTEKFIREDLYLPAMEEQDRIEKLKIKLKEQGHDFNDLSTEFGINPYNIVASVEFLNYDRDKEWFPLDIKEYEILEKADSYLRKHYNPDIPAMDLILSVSPYIDDTFYMAKWKKLGFAIITDLKGIQNEFKISTFTAIPIIFDIYKDAKEVEDAYATQIPFFKVIEDDLKRIIRVFKSTIKLSQELTPIQKMIISRSEIEFNSGVFIVKVYGTQVLSIWKLTSVMMILFSKIVDGKVNVSLGVKKND